MAHPMKQLQNAIKEKVNQVTVMQHKITYLEETVEYLQETIEYLQETVGRLQEHNNALNNGLPNIVTNYGTPKNPLSKLVGRCLVIFFMIFIIVFLMCSDMSPLHRVTELDCQKCVQGFLKEQVQERVKEEAKKQAKRFMEGWF